MPSHKFPRGASSEELAHLRSLLESAATTAQRWRQAAEYALVVWAGCLMLVVIVWLLSAWLIALAMDIDYGLHSRAAPWILGISTPLCAACAVFSGAQWIKSWKDMRPLLRADLAAAQVIEEHYFFDAAKRFQEPEHGGLFYFLRTLEGQVLTLYDLESQELGLRDEDPLTSSFKPLSRLVMVRAPETGWVIGKTFTGEPLETAGPVELAVAPEQWPENERYCAIPWSQLETVLGPPAQAT